MSGSGSGRRRGGRKPVGDGLTIIYWRDIPAQVSATIEGVTGKAMLEPRFQHAIDRAATVAGLTDTDDYVAQWRRVPLDAGGAGSAGESATTTAARIEADYPRQRLESLVAAGGSEPAASEKPPDDPKGHND